MSQKERDITYQSAVRFCEKNPAAVIELLDEDDIREKRQQQRTEALMANVSKICSGDQSLIKRVQEFVQTASLSTDTEALEEFLALLASVAKAGVPAADSNDAGDFPPDCADLVVVDANICCFATGKLYTDALLGVGVGRDRRNLTTAAELLSKEAFDGGLRQSTNKSPFEFFLPVWINEAHAANSVAWCEAVKSSYVEIGSKMFQVSGEDNCIIEVFPRLINQMIVEVMKPEAAKSAAIATFEALCNFWRTLRWLVDTRPTLLKRICHMLSSFVADEACRHKDNTPDLGIVLVLFTALQGHDSCPSRHEFIRSYADENSLRWVMWWQKSGTRPEPRPVFEATRVSREICMFQMMVVDLIISDVKVTLKEMEETNCTLPERLEKLQTQWRQQKSSINDWADYFRCIGASPIQHGSESESAWVIDCVRRAAAKGLKYGGSKGDGKGDCGNGKGNGKGAGRGWGRR
jgi:hypothetical protein